MLCQKCYKRQATIKFAQIVNDQQREYHVCEQCAEELGLNKALSNLPQIFTGLMLDILKSKEKQAGLPVPHADSGRCPVCGRSWEDFRRSGILGCDNCYLTFREKIKKVLQDIHGTSKHIGQRPREQTASSVVQSLSFLEKALQEAISREEYEKAAEYRDRIRALKQRLKRRIES